MAKIVVDKFVDKAWKEHAISQNDIKKIIKECLRHTGIEINQVFLKRHVKELLSSLEFMKILRNHL